MKDIKVLVIAANPFSDINNNGKTLKSIFCSFDKNSLFELYFRPQDNIIGDGEFAQSYYAFSELDIIRSYIHFNKKCGGVQVFERAKNKAIVEDQTYKRFLHGNLKNNRFLRSLLWKSRRWDTKEFREWYQNCNPDVVFALLGGPSQMFTIAEEISKKLNIPLVVYFTDDYLIHPSSDKIRKKTEVAFRKIINHSSARYCIGEQMCEEYGRFFNADFLPIMNSADVIPYSPITEFNSPLVISYFGGISLGRWEMISRLADVVKNDAVIKVYTAHEITDEIAAAFDKSNIMMCGKVLGKDLDKARQSSDCLLHVECDKEEYRSRTALSISTKIPESLMQSRLLVAYGPSEVASMQLIQKNDLGLYISSELPLEQQRDLFSKFINNPERIQEKVAKAYDYACKNFDKQVVSKQLKSELIEIVKNKLCK